MTAKSPSNDTPGSGRGRPSEITAVSATLLGFLRDGISQEDAATLAGITPRTMYRWLADGRAEMERLGNNPLKTTPVSSLVAMSVTKIKEAIAGGLSRDMLMEILAAEQAGKNRGRAASILETAVGEAARLEPHIDFVIDFDAAKAAYRQTLRQSANVDALGAYEVKETKKTIISKGGMEVQTIEEERVKQVGPNGQLALRLMQYADRAQANKKPEGEGEADPRLPMLEKILQMSLDELQALNENLEAIGA